MKLAVLSGKGGTGKTFVTVNLAAVVKDSTYIDCDVEEPNGYLFFKPENIIKENISVKIPYIDNDLCNGCRLCVDFCNFNALAYINKVIVFDEICHSCGGCMHICKTGAIYEVDKEIGRIESGKRDDTQVISGILNIGTMSGTPIVNKMLSSLKTKNTPQFIDCPPGSSCLVMESIKSTDYCLIIIEPTIFSISNAAIVLELVQLLNKPYGVVINKDIPNNTIAEDFCRDNDITVLEKISFDKEIGKLNSNGEILVNLRKKYRTLFQELYNKICKEVKHEAIINT